MINSHWETNRKPIDEKRLCVIWYDDDYHFAFWVKGVGCWDCPGGLGFVEDKAVKAWVVMPPELSKDIK